MASVDIERIERIEMSRLSSYASGNAAYDLSVFSNAVPKEEPLPEQPRVPVKTRIVAEKRESVRVPLVGIVGVVVVLALLLSVIFCNMRLNEIVDSTNELSERYSTLKEESKTLNSRYVTSLNLDEIEKTAATELGMVHLDRSDVIYLDLSGEDKAVVVGEKEEGALVSALKNTLSYIAEYFR